MRLKNIDIRIVGIEKGSNEPGYEIGHKVVKTPIVCMCYLELVLSTKNTLKE